MNPRKIIIIGGGPGGYVAAIRAAQLGAKVVLVEKDRVGGTCLNRGCIPTKALLADAGFLRSFSRSSLFGSITLRNLDLIGPMMVRKKQVVGEMVRGVELLLESHRVTLQYGRGDLLGRNQVVVSDQIGNKEILDAEAIILAPGSKPKEIPGFTPDGEKILTSDDALEISKIPREIVILGGGYIGAEFATLFNSLGSKVTVIEILDDILLNVEGELVRNLKRVFEREGVKLLTKSVVEDFQQTEEGIRLMVRTPQGIQEIRTEEILVAAGRAPNLDLDFGRAGVQIASTGIQVNFHMETTAPPIYAIGDAIGGPLLAHVASEEGIIAAENIMGFQKEMDYSIIPACIFTHPEIASVGLTEKEARGRGAIKIGRFPFRSNPKAVISGETDGLIKVVASKEKETILGVHIIGYEASTLISIASTLLRQDIKARDFVQTIQSHPTVSEALKEAVLDLDGQAVHLPKPLRGMKK
jgi:dihydrolipoamide dehydrogenase